ncbi:putative 18S rRNA (guanine-N(7))-methyltransferase [Hypsibius exemplaris]|uniref:18S rRNA (guanine-N(7))-methyltransferase n=1 Tax=Hypsibius exemplaris TaxID=2072580 RepID=A0A9X6RL68_HYPEX|nr:putative 18S rRNA (guanine-N(7))-methyltransferase [Hypsibius exemplaris]
MIPPLRVISGKSSFRMKSSSMKIPKKTFASRGFYAAKQLCVGFLFLPLKGSLRTSKRFTPLHCISSRSFSFSMASRGRPEHQAPPDLFYNEEEARKYTSNSRIINVQLELTERAIELLQLPADVPCYLLDLGCGSGLSGETLTGAGHQWVGMDISAAMLDVAVEREVEGDVMQGDLGQGVPYRPGSFDGAISISALQWLCNADQKDHNPPKRLFKFFSTLYASLSRGSRAVFQFYPENSAQVELITQQSMRAGFTGGLVVDYPNSARAKKLYLVLSTGGVNPTLPRGLDGTGSDRAVESRSHSTSRPGKTPTKSRDWILAKKERRRRQGKECRPDSKFTGRRRPAHF